jgi:hypothetical protein
MTSQDREHAPSTPPPPPRAPQRLWPRVVVLLGHAAFAAGWWRMMPGGFPVGHPRFWANRALPALLLGVVALGLWSAFTRRRVVLRCVTLGLAGVWLAAAVSTVVAFPVSGWRLAVVPLAAAAVTALAARRRADANGERRRRRPAIAAAAAGVALGAALPWTQRAGEPATRPLNVPAALPGAGSDFTVRSDALLAPGVRVDAMAEQVALQRGRYGLTVHPLLTFVSRSPDRSWTIAAPRRARRGPGRRTGGAGVSASRSFQYFLAGYREDDAVRLLVGPLPHDDDDDDAAADEGPLVIPIEASSVLPDPVYSHLNSFCQIAFSGHNELSVSFSPCPDARVEVLPSDYPVGRPARMAFLTAGGEFVVAEATSGEKGPFRRLAAGPLARGDPLVITFHDDAQPVARVVLDDWSAQASTDLSPTAGWGLPANAIQFSRSANASAAPAHLFVTLAGTGVGRGWDSVGHAAGTYRNRMRVEWVAGVDEGAGE